MKLKYIFQNPIRPMTRMRNLSLFVIFAFLFNTSINAQNTDSIYVYLPTQTSGSEGQIITIPVKVRFFKDLTSAQFAIRWDSTVARFHDVSTFAIPGMTFGNHFGYNPIAADILRFAWYDNSLAANTIANDQIIFNLKLKIIGKKGSSSPIAFYSDDLTAFEFQDKDSKFWKYGFNSGTVTVNTVSVKDKHSNPTNKVNKPAPNPFSEETNIKLELTENQTVKLEIFDLTGKKIHQQSSYYEVGTQFVNINKNSNIYNSGIYLYRLSFNNGEVYSGKLIKQ